MGQTEVLRLWLRPAPEARSGSVLWVPPEADPRTTPRVKGPDLARLATLRESARVLGGDDALLYGPDGVVFETAHSALLWWRDGALCLPAADLPTLPSVTARLVLDLAKELRFPVIRERAPVQDLLELDTWTANALHGLTPVTGWITAAGRRPAPAPGDAGRALSTGLAALAIPLAERSWA